MNAEKLATIAQIENMISGTLRVYNNQLEVFDAFEKTGHDVSAMRKEAEEMTKTTIGKFQRAIDELRQQMALEDQQSENGGS